MKTIRKLFSLLSITAFAISAIVIPANAYSDGDRSVYYYSFNIKTNELCGCSSDSMQRLFNRQWVVTVSSHSNNSYGITYGMLWNNATEWSNGLASNTVKRSGTGNFGSTYFSSSSVGTGMYLGALINTSDLNKGVKTSGQWSADAPW